ncbi:DUF5133 domain-containing protein [Streptomyces sp. AV19]|uniref:DUF5133 domain-containing protein n=1 Tax=Streptomyces sp. AV19 TaxID=2793068 RepID=UPI0018FE3C54|nr:DUF5133 domain-containing protein [Streptomyces sp. AV19]MBH1933392.1 DUF5133 domain-containing protein [Streptomyces sp. AV19]MDG4536144.1 DUF5133 domain-containing protein [Streptomyces sp. AV19]
MLLAHPDVLRDLVERHAALERAAAPGTADPAVRQELADVTYTLCVSTGTRDAEAALRVARHRLAQAEADHEEAALPGRH